MFFCVRLLVEYIYLLLAAVVFLFFPPCAIRISAALLKSFSTMQKRVAELELQFSDLEKENAGLQKNLKDCHALLVAAKIDPGEYVSPFSKCVSVSLIYIEKNIISL